MSNQTQTLTQIKYNVWVNWVEILRCISCHCCWNPPIPKSAGGTRMAFPFIALRSDVQKQKWLHPLHASQVSIKPPEFDICTRRNIFAKLPSFVHICLSRLPESQLLLLTSYYLLCCFGRQSLPGNVNHTLTQCMRLYLHLCSCESQYDPVYVTPCLLLMLHPWDTT